MIAPIVFPIYDVRRRVAAILKPAVKSARTDANRYRALKVFTKLASNRFH
jgi:hypothetical protein